MGEVDSVFAKSTTALADIETEDTAVVILKFSSGALGVIEATTATRPADLEGSISILGEKGTVEIRAKRAIGTNSETTKTGPNLSKAGARSFQYT